MYSYDAQMFKQCHGKYAFRSYANHKGLDQPAHPHSLIRAFDVRIENNGILYNILQMYFIARPPGYHNENIPI